MMAGVTWILTVLCAAGCHLASASPVHSSTLVVPVGHNVSLLCNMTHRDEITWYLLRSEQLQPLLTVKKGRFGGTTDHHTNNHRMKCDGTLQTGLVSLEIQEVEEEDAGLYFCVGRFADKMHVNRGIQLTVDGAGRSSTDRMKQPCLSLGLCLLPALLAFCFVCVAGCYLWSGKPSVCSCCNPRRRDDDHRVTEEESLHYSSLKHPDKPRPTTRRGTRLAEEKVLYSTVNMCKKASHDHR
ncbi:uncharacterized protein LOC120718228 isoform X2 [Simochromis diagramma]|uniref:uncharacterized protein LOC120718228 isoform X2 n=1 Tax=Simochromis diagramma TaxID=43689 RepID=UPI001A7EEFDD|nr:uncharacterized protein LOC120718228 isoform X2 [Simochromis diagramma]